MEYDDDNYKILVNVEKYKPEVQNGSALVSQSVYCGGNRKKCRIAKMSNRHFFLFCGQGKNVELEKILQLDIFVVKFRKGKKVKLKL